MRHVLKKKMGKNYTKFAKKCMEAREARRKGNKWSNTKWNGIPMKQTLTHPGLITDPNPQPNLR